MRKRIYISGKITGEADYHIKFLCAENKLFNEGYCPVNPASFVARGTCWEKAMRTVLRAMLECDGVALLPDWRKSKGARIEKRLALEIGMPVKPIKDWRQGGGNENI